MLRQWQVDERQWQELRCNYIIGGLNLLPNDVQRASWVPRLCAHLTGIGRAAGAGAVGGQVGRGAAASGGAGACPAAIKCCLRHLAAVTEAPPEGCVEASRAGRQGSVLLEER